MPPTARFTEPPWPGPTSCGNAADCSLCRAPLLQKAIIDMHAPTSQKSCPDQQRISRPVLRADELVRSSLPGLHGRLSRKVVFPSKR